MKILKFGGTSLANAEKFIKIMHIIESQIHKEQISVILSAPAKITNYLEKIIKHHKNKKKIKKYIYKIFKKIKNIIKEINSKQKNFIYKKIKKFIKKEEKHLKKIIKQINILQTCPNKIYAYIISKGENFSINIMQALLKSRNHKITIIDPVKKILAIGNFLESIANIEISTQLIQKKKIPSRNIILMPGFIAGNKNKEMMLLGRNGSDYSATILTACLKGSCCEIWTDVDGIYTSDPRVIQKTKLLSSLTYQEAIKLSYFGAKVLHPKTIFPILNLNIPCIIKNTLNIKNKGTIIQKQNTQNNTNKIKGVTHLNNIIQIYIENKDIQIINHLHKKICKFLNNNSIWNILIPNTTYNNSINLYIKTKDKKELKFLIKKNFKKSKKIKTKIKITKNLAIISIIGNNLHLKKNLVKKIFKSLSNINVNILQIIQGNNKYSLSLVIKSSKMIIAAQSIHHALFNRKKIIDVFLVGSGGVGSALLKKIKKNKSILKKKNTKIKVCCIANSQKILININGIQLNNWKEELNKSKKKFKLNKILKIQKKTYLNNPVLVDCTSNNQLPSKYLKIIKNAFHIVTPNKIYNTLNMKKYKKLRNIAHKKKRKFLYETNVGAGLPVIETLKNIIQTGDKIIKFRGILSGSLSYIFGKLDNNISISQATKNAAKLGFTEPNPRDDLLGLDVARKLLILAREMGYKIELKDIKIQTILPKKFQSINNKTEFLKKLKQLDQYFSEKIKKTLKKNKVLRFIGVIKSTGQCYVKLKKIDKLDPLYEVKDGENALAFYSNEYQPIPLVIRGYGAGNNVTAAGIFTDLLKILS
ncbi:bifunctional aspartate kinase/homoserine dehydrogenase I [Buchnera aphidicola (Mollitrichosiphum nigrofasciatum)]|uniref:bifunctional aspartate kinase/homoserine dehydrogenase I n=1 Tax=Buchnera aphidicola TaxID=9 RepID=UPI0031B8772C